jgi:hypothetical protein
MQRIARRLHTDRRWLIGLLLIGLLIPAMAVHIAGAATINVNGGTGTDSPTCGASGSPCKTIGYAVTTRAGNGDAINVAAGTYTESVTIAKPVTITGAGQNATKIDGGNANQVLHINAGTNVAIQKLTVQNGNSNPGGGIYNGGTLLLTDAIVLTNTGTTSGGGLFNDGAGALNLKNVAISGNKAKTGAGIYNDGTATLDTTTINGNAASDSGGGIYNQGTLTITNAAINNNSATNSGLGGGLANTMATAKASIATTTVSGNTAKFGGGIANDTNGAVKVDQSTINGNTVTDIGGGIYNRGGGVVALTNSTLSGNRATPGAGGGFDSFGSTGILTNVTVAGNSSVGSGNNDGISTDGNMTLHGTLVADGCSGPITSADDNLDIGLSCKFTGPHDLKGTNPQIGPLANNGGPTFTHALAQGSPAVDAGGASCPPTDQRGIARPQGAACDIGAFELQQIVAQPTATAPPTATATATATAGNAACTPLAPGSPFANAAFQTQWQQGEALTPNFWGPPDTPPGLMESYVEAPGGQRLVQYFDKGRMELTDPATGTVTNGLLANELINGLLQTGNSAFQQRAAANIPIAGDPDNPGPTYAGLGTTAAALLNAAPAQTGILVTTTVAANGTITPGAATAGSGPTALATYDAATQHNVPTAFSDYRNTVGLLTVGLAKSEPFLTTVKVAGAQKQVMVQVFERRVLTYTADNPPAFRVEMGNIGQHYYQWRYCTS